MKVIAEDRKRKKAKLIYWQALGCHTLQGYYFAKPSPLPTGPQKDNAKAKNFAWSFSIG